MAKVELGFSGERFIYLPIPMIDLMEDSPLTSDLYPIIISTGQPDAMSFFSSIVRKDAAG